ncbi:hypothetical protein DFH07DRAFT_814247 [Mycena maculata]|uniref:NACHT domain-containing protein n=1 Tax=Mycena maculata TaxID=230809 RepID=A0AAD7JGZ1_9AGAR|nr:hypothetical protein DFH07DRAFT_814247 [Mycena maculata]
MNSPTTQGARSTFQRALDSYIASLPEKKKKRKFIVACCATTTPVTPESINESLKQAEQKHSDQPARRIANKILRPVVDVLRNFDDIINNLVSADPMPSAIIWGALKIVVDGAHRFLHLFDTIKKELRLLTTQLQRINDYEYLYGDSDMLQNLFCSAYINILRFWSRVDKECDTSWYTGMLKAASSFSTNKLNKIIKDIEDDADQIEQLASILEATKGKSERQAAELERFRAEMERTAAQKERTAQAAWREEAQADRQGERYRNISEWLCARQSNENDMRHFRALTGLHLRGTCEWLLQHRTYVNWRDGPSLPPILWVHAPPATGKSILSSRAIQALKEDPDAALAYHFYRFDQTNFASETLRLLASQLLDEHWRRTQVISEEMYMKTQQNVCSHEKLQELIIMLVGLLPRSYFILDGLDEECMGSTSNRWTEAVTTLDFLVDLAKASPDRVRLWYSSQYRPIINEKLKYYIVLDIKDEVKEDVSVYLSRANPELNELEISDADKDNVLESLQGRAEGNFLWASLMLKSLKDTASLSDMKQFVEDGLPDTLDDYYRRIFARFEKSHRPLVSKVFALVAFARRPLRMVEVREAVGLLLSKNPLSLDSADMPFISLLRKLFPPLIELQEDGCTDPDECTCRLFHSTVRDFLFKNPEVLHSGMAGDPATGLLIDEDVIANACMLYLCQTRYARPLRKRDARWIDASGDSVDRHQFLLYAAKYWDKSMDSMIPTEDLNNRVGSFITSTNFQTCVQVQSLWVDSQFGVFCYPAQKDDRIYLRRMFPAWFVSTPAGLKLWRDFREFVHEWKWFLHCPRFSNPNSESLPYTGELDRCWWPSLGSHNFLSKLKCKYPTFRFQNESQNINGGPQCFEGVGTDGKELVTLILKSRTDGSLVFTCEQWRWTPGERSPSLQKTQTIVTNEKANNWRLYVKPLTDEPSSMRAGRAPPAAFTQSNDFLRIGTQLFARDDAGDYNAIPGFSAAHPYHPAYIEEFAVRGQFTVLSSRRVAAAKTYHSGLPDEKLHFFGTAFLAMEGKSPVVIDEDDSELEFSDDSDSSSDSEDAGYETWSECSTEHSNDLEDDIITPWAGPLSDMEGDEEDSSSEADSSQSSELDSLGEGAPPDDSQTSVDSESEASEVDPSAVVGYGYWHRDDKDNNWGDSDSDDDRSEQGDSETPPGLKASITIFDTSSNEIPMRVFHFTRALPFLLYDSPPIIHPSKNLVVWPLSAGDVLFADFLAKTYFIRKLRPSTSHTRHIFMKGHFSPCGLYVHFASLEGQKKPVSRRKKELEGEQPIKLALLVSTYRLSSRKTSRSPPSLVHRARVYLGSATSLSVSKLPFTLTWTPTELYFTRSAEILRVSRIALFKTAQDSSPVQEPSVLVPRKPIFLPESAQEREVYYFPPVGDSKAATVILGSETRTSTMDVTVAPLVDAVDDQLPGRPKEIALYSIKKVFGHRSPPLGCYLREETDFGGWCKCRDRSKLPDDLGIAQLDRRLERFDPEDDCDLEPYVR